MSDRTARFVLYSGGEVRSGPGARGDVIATREFRLAPFRANPVVLADHDPTKVIGRGTAEIVQTPTGHRLEGDVTWDTAESNPLAILIAGQHARKMRNGASIGFMPGAGTVSRSKLPREHAYYVDPESVSWDAGRLIRYPELYEWSSVAVPRDAAALQIRDSGAVEQAVRDVLPRGPAEMVLRATRTHRDRDHIATAALFAFWDATRSRPSSGTSPRVSAELRAWWEGRTRPTPIAPLGPPSPELRAWFARSTSR